MPIHFIILRKKINSLLKRDVEVTVFPATAEPEQILNLRPNGILVSNGPGNPMDYKKQIKTIQKLYDAKVPMFGVALGHQLIAIAKGAKTEKLKYGHRGPNHPVKDLKLDRVHITSQNHGYYVSEETLDKSVVEVSHVSLNDGTVEGLRYKDNKVFTIQFYPEDADYIFDEFIKMM